MSEALWIILIVNILAVFSVWIKAYFDYKSRKKNKVNSNPGNPGDEPGEAEICKNNRDIIIETKTKVENIEENIKAIFKLIDKG